MNEGPNPNGTDRDAEIRAAMAEFGVDESEAAFIVAMGHGEIDGDVLSDPPLLPEERERLGLDRHVPQGVAPTRV